jgi:integrase/recombinase XerD
MDFLTPTQVAKLLQHLTNERHRLQVLLMGDGGLRVSEMITLQWSDFDFRKKIIRVKSLKKGKAVVKREIPISSRLYDELAQYIENNGRNSGYIFSTDNGKSHVTRQSVNKMLKKLELDLPELPDLHPHLLRHSFATNLRANGAELEDIRDALGYEKLETSLIYAHQDPEKLRGLIIDSQTSKKLARWQRIRRSLFPFWKARNKKNKISVLEYDANYTVGREQEVKRIEAALDKDISVILVGEIGVGKTHLLNALRFPKPVLELDNTKEFKKSVVSILLWLFNNDKEQVAEMLFNKTERDTMHNRMNRESVLNLCELLMQVTTEKEYILRIGDIDSITPTISKALELLKTHFTMITTARAIKMNAIFVWDFERIEIERLNRIETLRLFHRLTDQLDFESTEHARNKVWDTTEGNPKMIVELCTRLSKEDMLIPEVINEVCDGYIDRQIKEIDMSFALMLVMGGVMAMRYIGRESEDPDLRMIGGLMMIVLLFARSFFRVTKRQGL